MPKRISPPPFSARPMQPLLTRHYALLSPLFGGGVQPCRPDFDNPVSGKSLRGHLRMWWRAVTAGRFNADRKAMFEKECEIWGTTSGTGGPSRVTLEVSLSGLEPETFYTYEGWYEWSEKDTDRGRFHDYWKWKHDFVRPEPAPGYLTFPLRPPDPKTAPKDPGQHYGQTTPRQSFGLLAGRVAFSLTIHVADSLYHDAQDLAGVQQAILVWQTLGGVGGRTRRGFGAVGEIVGPWSDGDRPNWSLASLTDLRSTLDLQRPTVPNEVWPQGTPRLLWETIEVVDASWQEITERFRRHKLAIHPEKKIPTGLPNQSLRRSYLPSRLASALCFRPVATQQGTGVLLYVLGNGFEKWALNGADDLEQFLAAMRSSQGDE